MADCCLEPVHSPFLSQQPTLDERSRYCYGELLGLESRIKNGRNVLTEEGMAALKTAFDQHTTQMHSVSVEYHMKEIDEMLETDYDLGEVRSKRRQQRENLEKLEAWRDKMMDT